MYKHFFFDLDNTVTRSRSEIETSMKKTLEEMMKKGFDIIIVSGAKVEQSKKQMLNFPCYYLGQNGNHAHDGIKGKDIWKYTLTADEREEIMDHINSIPRTWGVSDEGDLIQDRICQISYSLLGHNEKLEKKEAFDSDFSKRKNLLKKYPLISNAVEVKIGGTTCLDYFPKGKHKGSNVSNFIKYKNWNKKECLYIGDALFPGGNDEDVLGVMNTKQVENPKETLEFIKSLIVKSF